MAYSFYNLKIALLRRLFFPFGKLMYRSFGKKSIIYKPLAIIGKKSVSVGCNVTVRNNARIECVGKLRKKDQLPLICIEDNVMIEQNLHLTAANSVKIEKNTIIGPDVYISDVMHGFEDPELPVMYQELKIKDTLIGEDSWIGIGVRILAGVHIGKHCVIGANSVVTHDVPDYSVAVGIPAKVIKRYNFSTKQWEKC